MTTVLPGVASTTRYTALEIAEVLGRPAPTPEQRAVIEAPLVPALVVAGAGSGKTETMASRVVWLLANGHVTVSQVLGLTFTRKAAGELRERIEQRIALLAERGLLDVDHDPFDAPVVSTYNAFANAIFRDHALLVGRESESQVLSGASAWQLARGLVIASTDSRLASLGKSVDTLTQSVIDLSHALADNVADPNEVRDLVDTFVRLEELPAMKSTPYASVVEAVGTVGALPPLLDLAEAFAAEKAARGLVEFSDQVSLALEVCESAAGVVEEFRDRFRVILLDEYQDTSVVQTRLLARLFHGTGVMGVGDPHQSIYGFRGASAANLGRFPFDFGADGEATYSLSTSWRNARRVLDSANAVVDVLAKAADAAVGALSPRPKAPDGTVEVAFSETVVDEAAAVAGWFARELALPSAEGSLKSAALLFRSKKTLPVFAEALEARGVRFHILGVGGLLQRPEIVDLVSCLRVLHDPAAGSELIRLLAGARWRVGLHDIAALRDVASWLFRHDHAQQLLADDVNAALRASVSPGEQGSIVDALDFVATAHESHTQLAAFTPSGLERIRRLGRQLAFLRGRIGLDLIDLVTLVQQEMLLDVEVAAAGGSAKGGAYLQAFSDEVAGYVATDDSASLPGFLSWLSAAERRDDMGPRSESGEAGVVQLLTIHGSKGLEWDLVAVPRLVEDELPGASRGGKGWLAFGQLPYEFRGDSAELPLLTWRRADDQKELDQAVKDFAVELKARNDAEERRLAYVAVTRARDQLLLSGSFWATQSKPRRPSRYLRELVEAGILPEGALPDEPAAAENPLTADSRELVWPIDPFGARRGVVEAAAALVREAEGGDGGGWGGGGWGGGGRGGGDRASSGGNDGGVGGGVRGGALVGTRNLFARDLDLLIAERNAHREAGQSVTLPQRIPASRFKDYVDDPAAVASALRRPLPEKPYRATRLGTLFHAWVEDRFRPTGATETLDAGAFELDLDDDDFEPVDAVDPVDPVEPVGSVGPVRPSGDGAVGSPGGGLVGSPGGALGEAPAVGPGGAAGEAPTLGSGGAVAGDASGVPVDAAVDADDARRLAELQATFEASEWAPLEPVDVELEIHLPLGARTVICKIDAVFERDGRFQVVDWKTGKAPSNARDLELKQLQLALYREAYSAYRGIDPSLIDAVFYFVADDVTLQPSHVSDRAELERLWAGVEGVGAAGGGAAGA